MAQGHGIVLMPRTKVGEAVDCQAKDERRLLAGAARLGRITMRVLLLVEVVRPQRVEAPRHAAALGVKLGGRVALGGPASLALGVNEGELPQLGVVALLQAARELATQGRAVQSAVSEVRVRMVCGWRGEGESESMQTERRTFVSKSVRLLDADTSVERLKVMRRPLGDSCTVRSAMLLLALTTRARSPTTLRPKPSRSCAHSYAGGRPSKSTPYSSVAFSLSARKDTFSGFDMSKRMPYSCCPGQRGRVRASCAS